MEQLDDLRVSDKVIRNTSYNVIGRIWFGIVGVFLTPYIINHIGVERFAVWALVSVITNYFALLDFGVGSSFIKYVSEFYTQKDYPNINNLVNTGFGFYALFALVIIGVTVFFQNALIYFLKVPVALYQEASFVFFLGIAVFCVSNAMGVFMAISSGLQRMDITNKISVAASCLNIAGTMFFLESGYGLRGLMVNNALIFAVSSLMYIVTAYKLLPQLKFRPLVWDPKMFKRVFSFGFRVQMSRISGTIIGQTDKILITYFLTIGLVTYYQLGNSVVSYAMTIPALLISALVPAFSEIEARGERRKLIEAYLRSTKYLVFLTAPLFVFVAVSAYRIMFIWMGSGYEQSALIIQILAASYLLNMIARVSGALCMAIEKPEHMMQASLIMLFSNVVWSIILIKLFGFSGVAWGTLVAVNGGTFYFLWKLHRNLGISSGIYLRATGPFFGASVFSGAFVVGFDFFLKKSFPPARRIIDLVIFIFMGLFFSLIYLLTVYKAKLFDSADFDFFKEKFPVVFRVFRKNIKANGK